MNNLPTLKKLVTIVLAAYVLLATGLYFLGGEQFHKRETDTGTMVSPTGDLNELLAGETVQQPFVINADQITSVTLMTATYGRVNTCSLMVSVLADGKTIAETTVQASELRDAGNTVFTFPQAVDVPKGKELRLKIASPDGNEGNAVTVYYGSSISVSKGSVDVPLDESQMATLDGELVDGILCYQVNGSENLLFGKMYWYGAGLLGLLLAVYGWLLLRKAAQGSSSPTLRFIDAIQRYAFLIEQLVNRDFKTKYKRSVLGVCWSFLNPLLMMSVQYIVFSTLFKSDIQNFQLYLLTGIVCFNFFNESTSMCLTSISGNAGLITKVYVPKYIYPVTRVLSSGINFALALIPLLIVMVFTRTPIRPQILLIVFGVLCLAVLCLGIGLILAAVMVFFRDTQFIWGVLVTILNFATPIFYPESIIPQRFMTIYKMNPLYHMVRFMRIVLMDGISPEPKAYLLCLIAAGVPLLLGIALFKKQQDKFILYI